MTIIGSPHAKSGWIRYPVRKGQTNQQRKHQTTIALTSPGSLSPSHHPPPPPLSNRHKEGEINHKCRRCGKSAFYLHGPMNKQKSKQFACFQSVVMLHQTIIKLYFEPGVLLNIHVILQLLRPTGKLPYSLTYFGDYSTPKMSQSVELEVGLPSTSVSS